MVKRLLLLPAVLLFGFAATLAPTWAQAGAQALSKTNGEIPAHVKTIYTVDCAMCHGATGDGKTDLAKDMNLTLGDLTDPKTLEGKSDQDLFALIRKGKDKMPPEEENRAKDAEIHTLIQYIRSFSKNGVTPAATPAPAPAAATAPGNN